MPTYDYICEKCGHEFEQLQSITSNPLRKCPKCGKNNLKRLIGAGAGIIFKGSGFYQTDYRTEGYKKAEKSEKSVPAPKETKETKPKETKPAEKAKLSPHTKRKTA